MTTDLGDWEGDRYANLGGQWHCSAAVEGMRSFEFCSTATM